MRVSNDEKGICKLRPTALRYCATFKMRKFESLFYKISTGLQKTTTNIGFIAGRANCYMKIIKP